VEQAGNRRILAIDDDINLLDFYKDILIGRSGSRASRASVKSQSENSEHFELTTATNGKTGYEYVLQSIENDEPFAVAFIDKRMSPGWDGLKTAKHIREADDRIFIVIITGYLDDSVYQFQEVLKHDVLCFSKPMRVEEIYQMAKTLCARWDKDFGQKPTKISRESTDKLATEKNIPVKPIKLSGLTETAKKILNHNDLTISAFPFEICRQRPHLQGNTLTENYLHIEDNPPYNISKTHLSINHHENQYYILDCGSTLGTIVNGQALGSKSSTFKATLNKGENIIIIGSESSPYQFYIHL